MSRRRAAGRAAAAALVAALVTGLAGCGGDDTGGSDTAPTPPATTLTARDRALSVALPDGWSEEAAGEAGKVVVAARGPQGERLRVSVYGDPSGAEQAAITETELLNQRHVICERLDDSDALGDPHLVFDCSKDGTLRRLVYVVLVDDARSALLGIELDASSLDQAADVVGPAVDGLSWS